MDWKAWASEKIVDFLFGSILKIIKPSKRFRENKINDTPIRDVIKNEENYDAILVKSKIRDFNTKSILFVMPGEEAVFINNGKIVEILTEGRHILDTSNYPFLSNLVALSAGKRRVYCSDIYFLKTSVSHPVDWGTSIQVRDPVQRISTRVMCRGVYRIQIVDGRMFIRYFIGNGRVKLEQYELSELLQDEIIQIVKAYLSNYIISRKDEILGISSKQQILSEQISENIMNHFGGYGIKIASFAIVGMDILNDDPNRKRIENAYGSKRIKEIIK